MDRLLVSSNDDDVVLIMVPCGGRSPKTINLSPTSSRLLSVVGLFVDCCCTVCVWV